MSNATAISQAVDLEIEQHSLQVVLQAISTVPVENKVENFDENEAVTEESSTAANKTAINMEIENHLTIAEAVAFTMTNNSDMSQVDDTALPEHLSTGNCSQHSHSCAQTQDTRSCVFENDAFEWTEECPSISTALPPSFSKAYLYVRNKSLENVMYIPGTCITSPARDRRPREIYLCAVKCAASNEINFMYLKAEDVEMFFKGSRILNTVIQIIHTLC